jgi:hypothetical protein
MPLKMPTSSCDKVESYTTPVDLYIPIKRGQRRKREKQIDVATDSLTLAKLTSSIRTNDI